MSSIDLTGLPIQKATPQYVDFGGVLTPALGGPQMSIDRAGSRWAWQFQTPPMPVEPFGRRWAADLTAARKAGAIMPISQPNFDVGAPGAPLVSAATASGKAVPIHGLTPGYVVRKGQWASIIHNGQRYLDLIAAEAGQDEDGVLMLALTNLLRTPLVMGDVLELGKPKIEGLITADWSWDLDASRTISFAFTITEAA